MPQPRPETAPQATVAAPSEPSACRLQLADIATIEALPPVTGADGCGIEDPVRLSAVMTKEKKRLAVTPPVMLGCEMAEALAHWLREDVAPSPPRSARRSPEYPAARAISAAAATASRARRSASTASGKAMDIRAIVLANGTSATSRPTSRCQGIPRAHQGERLRVFHHRARSRRSDGYHENYIHLDVAARRSGYPDLPVGRARRPRRRSAAARASGGSAAACGRALAKS